MSLFKVSSGMVMGLMAGFLNVGAANAGSISTPIVFLSASTDQVFCIANNVSSSSVRVTVKIINVLTSPPNAINTCTLPASDRGGCQVSLFGAGQCRISSSTLTHDQLRDRVRGVMYSRAVAGGRIEAAVQAE